MVVSSITKLIECYLLDQLTTKMSWPHLMYPGMNKFISLPHIHVRLARWNEYKYFIFQDRAYYKKNSSLRTLIQFHFRMAKMYLCPFSTPINEEILRKID